MNAALRCSGGKRAAASSRGSALLGRSAFILALGLQAAACTLQPRYERLAAPVAPKFATGPAYETPAAEAAGSPPAAEIGWRDFLGDPRLQRLTSLVDLYRYLGGGWIGHAGEAPRPPDAPGESPAG